MALNGPIVCKSPPPLHNEDWKEKRPEAYKLRRCTGSGQGASVKELSTIEAKTHRSTAVVFHLDVVCKSCGVLELSGGLSFMSIFQWACCFQNGCSESC